MGQRTVKRTFWRVPFLSPVICRPALCYLALLLTAPMLWAQKESPASPNAAHALRLPDAVRLSLQNYPAIRAATAQASAASAGVQLARTAYLPHTELLWQSNRATRNNILGLFFPGSTPLPISGPVLGTNSGTSVWGTAAGFLFSWEPFDFGARRAKVDLARAEESRFTAAATLAQLDTAVGAADAFLTLLASQQTVRAAKASVERSEVLLKAVDALVQSALRPGADAARAQAELATAQNQLIQAEQTEQVHQLTLAEWLGMAGTAVAVQSGPLVDVQPSEAVAEGFVKNHPLAVAQSANLDIVRARQRQLDRAYFPQFDFLASTYSRGTGALTNGQVLGGWNGLAPDTFNWAVGFTAKFRLFDFAVLREKKAVEEHHLNLESAKLDQVIQSLTTQTGKAKADWEASRRIAANTPVQLEAARIAERQVTARYRAGLATLVEVADAQRLLTQAETEDSVARLRVWRALLGLAAARGDLEPFLNEVRKVSTARP